MNPYEPLMLTYILSCVAGPETERKAGAVVQHGCEEGLRGAVVDGGLCLTVDGVLVQA